MACLILKNNFRGYVQPETLPETIESGSFI